MKKSSQVLPVGATASPEQVSVAMAEIAESMQEGLLALAVGAGLQVMPVLMEADVTAFAGPKGRHDQARTAVRHGRERSSIGRKMTDAYHAGSALEAEAALLALAKELDRTHPGAAASLREGLHETLTVLRLGVPPTLARTLRSTNAIESMISVCREHAGNVKRWRDSQMAHTTNQICISRSFGDRLGSLTTGTSPDRGERDMSVSQALAAPVDDDTVKSMELATRNVFLEPRCRVCRNDLVRKKVNDLLATGSSYAFIVRALGDDNANCDRRDLVTIDSVRNHCERHFPVQQVARATYRDIVERRAQENQIDFVKGVATALLPVTFFEVAMNKAFRALVDDRTEVSVETGLRAAEKLQSVLDGRERGTEVLELKVALDQTREAVRAVVPQSMWGAIIEKLEELEQHQEALGVGRDSFDGADDDAYDPTEFIDEDDEF